MKTARHEDGSSCAPIILLTDDTYRGIIYQMDILCPLPKLNDAEDSSFLCHIPSSYMIRIYKSKKKKEKEYLLWEVCTGDNVQRITYADISLGGGILLLKGMCTYMLTYWMFLLRFVLY